jgi:hypothetical protein
MHSYTNVLIAQEAGYDLIIPFTLSLSARTHTIKGSWDHKQLFLSYAWGGQREKGPGQRKICPCLAAVATRTENTSPQAMSHPTKLLQASFRSPK